MVEERPLYDLWRTEASVKARAGEKLILFGPLGLWRTFRFAVRLRIHGIEYRICQCPRSVAVRERDLHRAGPIFDAL